MGKTIVPIKIKGYKVVHGVVDGKTPNITVDFDSTVICVFAGVQWANSSSRTNVYAVNKNSSFFENDNTLFDNSYPSSNYKGYISGSNGVWSQAIINDKSITFQNSYTSDYQMGVMYTAILEDNLEDDTRSIFLLNGTILYTDGTPTTDVAGAIQTVDTNKYKIKSNALINIDNATYIDLSN